MFAMLIGNAFLCARLRCVSVLCVVLEHVTAMCGTLTVRVLSVCNTLTVRVLSVCSTRAACR